MTRQKNILTLLILLLGITPLAFGQSLDFQTTAYYTASGSALTTSGENLSAFDYSTASPSHPIFNDGLYYPVEDVLGNNLWVRVRHIADDPNGTSVGFNISATQSSPFRDNGFGGWSGFLYQLDIFADKNITGTRQNILGGTFKTTIKVESIETLSYPEWVSFEITDNAKSEWVLNSINFTGNNPSSTPGFSPNIIPYDSPDFSADFPTGSNKLSVIDLPAGGFSEFSISANSVSQFKYGYEYQDAGGYQGMRLSFGTAALLPTIISFDPTSGSPGTTVTITGTNFDPTPENNTVMFNGVTATVTASSNNSITVIVPPKATTGFITVTIGIDTATSEDEFVIITNDLIVFNGVSPNGDGRNDVFFIQNIDVLPDTRTNTVQIYNRWGDEVFSASNYNNTSVAFKGESSSGKRLPAGTYFYKIISSTGKTITGYLSLR